jgi:hypothetical protein
MGRNKEDEKVPTRATKTYLTIVQSYERGGASRGM